MQDRISNHPNRWVLTPVTGESNTYDFTRADDPTQVGTPLNKATFLPDTVATAIETLTGESDIELPSDALSALTTAISSIGLSNNAKVETMSYTGDGGYGTRTTTFTIHPRIVFYMKDGSSLRDTANNNTSSTITCPWQVWVYNSEGGDRVTFSYSEANKQLSRTRVSSTNFTNANYATKLMNSSGVTYWVVAIGVI